MRYEAYVYDAFERDFTHSGLVGALTPISCVHKAIAGNLGELTLVHPIDGVGKWMGLERGNIIKAHTYVRTTAETDGGKIVTTVEKWTVKETSSKEERDVYSAQEEGVKKGRLKKGEGVIVVKRPFDGDRYKIKGGSVNGWVHKDALQYDTEVIIPEDDPTAIEDIFPRWEMRAQLFRIYDEDRSLDSITVRARPIFGDLYGNMTVYKNVGAKTLHDAATSMLARCVTKHPFNVYTNIADERTGMNWRHKNPIFAFFDPEEGICAKWGVQAVIDDYDITLMKQVGKNRGMSVEYGRNLLGISCQIVDEEVVTCVLPTGVKEDGNPLYLTDSTDELDAGNYIHAANEGEYPGPHVYHLECDDCTVSEELSVDKARQRMRQQAKDMLDSGVTMPRVNIKVTFANLGSTEEYKAWKALEKIDLYDKVRVKVPKMGVDALLDAVSTETDCMTGRTLAVEIGALEDVQIQVSGHQISGISGGKIYAGTIRAPQLGDGAIHTGHISAQSITAQTIAANAINAGHISAGAVEADKIKAGAITTEKMEAGTIDAKVLKSGTITAELQLLGEGVIDTAQIKEASITEGKIVSLNADKIKTGVLSADRLMLKGKDGIYYRINAEALGEGSEKLTQEEYQTHMDGSVIVAKSITAEQIAAAAITTNKIAANAITAAKIDVVDLFASEATINALNAMDISGNEYLRLYVKGEMADLPPEARNYILGTADAKTATGNGTTNQAYSLYETAPDFYMTKPPVGTEMTLSFKWATSGATGEFTPQWSGGGVYQIGTGGSVKLTGGVQSGEYVHTFRFGAAEHAAPLTGIRLRLDMTGSVTISEMKLERGSAATAWIPAPEDPAYALIAGSTVKITEKAVNISTPEFTVDIPTTEGSDVQVNELGFAAPVILSPTVAKAGEGGIYTVGTNGDFASLAEAFSNINGRVYDENIVLKVTGKTDPGGTIRGVRGAGRVLITPINMINAAQSAAWSGGKVTPIDADDGAKGVIVQAASAGTYRQAVYKVGHIGVLGLRGQKMTLRASMRTGSATDLAYPRIAVYAGGTYVTSMVRSASNPTAKETKTVTFTVPQNIGAWNELELRFYMSTTETVTTTAKAYYEDIRLEMGGAVSSQNTGVSSVTTAIEAEGCTAEVDMHALVFPGDVKGYQSALYANRCTFTGSNGFMLWGGSGAVYNCYGACSSTAVLAAGGAAVQIYGTAPTGTRSGIIDESGASTGTPPAGETPIVENTMTLNATKTGTYSGGSWMSGAAMRQGYTPANGRMRGGMWFDTSALSGKEITKMTLRLKRAEGYGKGGNVAVKVYGTDSAALSGQPAIKGTAVEKSMAQGQVKVFDVTSLKAYSGFVLYADDTSVMSGKTYSDNYARFTGTGGGTETIPQLVVTYK